MTTEPELKAIIKKERGGTWIEYHGPFKIGAADVWGGFGLGLTRRRRIRLIGLLKHNSGWKMTTVRNFTSPILQT